jgi:hypothetical protein
MESATTQLPYDRKGSDYYHLISPDGAIAGDEGVRAIEGAGVDDELVVREVAGEGVELALTRAVTADPHYLGCGRGRGDGGGHCSLTVG